MEYSFLSFPTRGARAAISKVSNFSDLHLFLSSFENGLPVKAPHGRNQKTHGQRARTRNEKRGSSPDRIIAPERESLSNLYPKFPRAHPGPRAYVSSVNGVSGGPVTYVGGHEIAHFVTHFQLTCPRAPNNPTDFLHFHTVMMYILTIARRRKIHSSRIKETRGESATDRVYRVSARRMFLRYTSAPLFSRSCTRARIQKQI